MTRDISSSLEAGLWPECRDVSNSSLAFSNLSALILAKILLANDVDISWSKFDSSWTKVASAEAKTEVAYKSLNIYFVKLL